jgi:CheY-like chemotaxis protein
MGNIKARIMLVEDEAIIAVDIRARLIKLGYEVPRIVSTGEDAISSAAELKPDLILMDISLRGDILGTEAARKIHDLFDIPIIFSTAYAGEQIIEKAKMAEPLGYLTKPIEDIDLRVTIEIALCKAKAEKERKELTIRLQKALEEIQTLNELIPICASCKKIRDDAGYWESVKQYINQHPEAMSTSYQDSVALFAWQQYVELPGARFTRRMCPDCGEKLNPT